MRGFRSGSLARDDFIRNSRVFAANEELLADLLEIALSELGATGSSIQLKISDALEANSLEPQLREVLASLTDISSLAEFPLEDTPTPSQPNEHSEERSPTIVEAAVSSQSQDAAVLAGEELSLEQDQGDQSRGQPAPPLIWDPPTDSVSEVQDAVTVFERALVQFVKWKLQELHGEGWLRKGCSQFRKQWREKLDRGGTVEPDTLIGAAEFGDLKDIIVMRANWKAFSPYFSSKEWVKGQFEQIIPLRISGMHPGERILVTREFMGPFAAMIAVLNKFHEASAEKVDRIFWDTGDPEQSSTRFSQIVSNLASIPADPRLVGREDEEVKIEAFWADPYQRVLSITGHGGVGKTALLDSFIHKFLSQPVRAEDEPGIEVVVYLTAKTEWLEDKAKVSPELGLKDLESVCNWAIDVMDGDRTGAESLDDLKRMVYDQASELPILFALDNLESLDDAEVDALNAFLAALPQPSKAILTTRDDLHVGEKMNLEGLPNEAALDLLLRKLSELNTDVDLEEDGRTLRSLIDELSGVPIYVLHCANMLAQGETAPDIIKYMRGRGMLKLMEFSYETSIRSLSEAELGLLYFLALSQNPQPRKRMKELFADADAINAGIRRLQQLSFIQREARQVSNIRWTVTTRQIRDYAKKRANDLLPPERIAAIAAMARVPFEATRSTRVSEAVEKIINDAADHGRYDPDACIAMLEAARTEFGDEPRLLEELGYRCYRQHRREEARKHLLNAEATGYESALLMRTLALIEFFDRNYQESEARAEAALTISPDDHIARQVLGEAMIERAKRHRLILDESQRRLLLEAGREHLSESRFTDPQRNFELTHNLRSDEYVLEVDRLLA